MPVTLRQINENDGQLLLGCQRVIQSNLENAMVAAQWQRYQSEPAQFDLWAGIFNDRVVGLMLVSANQVCLVVVHRATQKRGVATRMIELLYKKDSALQWPPSLERFIQK